jgi:regulator of sigma E protease
MLINVLPWLISISSFLVLISIIVVFHELGHYWVGRLLGTDIDAFSIGFGPKLLGWTDRLGTQWKVCLLPLGGYVKFRGDANSASLPDQQEVERLRAQMIADGVDPHRIFQLKPLIQRVLIVVAGPLANFVLAMIVFMGVFSIAGEGTYPVMIERVVEGTPAATAGLRPGDQIIAIDGWKLYSGRDVSNQVASAPNRPLTFTISREGRTFAVVIRPAAKMETPDGMSHPMRLGRIGIAMQQPEKVEIYHHGPLSAAARGYHFTVLQLDRTLYYLMDVVTGQTAADQLSGPVGIAAMAGEVAKRGPVDFILFIGFVSVAVGFVNLFPIPVLDGGHLLFYAIEAIQGRPLSHRLQEIGFRIGLALLALLFVFVTWNDFLYHLPKSSGPAP